MALQLADSGHGVTIIEKNPQSLRRLGKQYPCRIVMGSGLDMDVLEKANVSDADAFFAVTRGDNTNLMAAQIVLRKFNVKRVAVKVADPQRAQAYRKLGLFCINASALLAGMCKDWLTESPYQTIDSYNVPGEFEV